MVKTASTMLPLGTQAPEFSLQDTDGRMVASVDFRGAPALLVVFMCNHCPYVIHIAAQLAELAAEYRQRGVAVVGINSNDVSNYPQDSPENMKLEVERRGFTFPYLFDETQDVAKSYGAACTPDFFLFDGDQRLVYRGQMDSSRPNSETEPTGRDLRQALDAVLTGSPVSAEQRPSLGCNIKWQDGKEPSYFDPQGVSNETGGAKGAT